MTSGRTRPLDHAPSRQPRPSVSVPMQPLPWIRLFVIAGLLMTPSPVVNRAKAAPPDALPVIPGAAGFGMDTPAGRGGEVLRVTTLADSGPGSLRAALEVKGPRVIVFEVSGTIATTRHFVIREPFVTVAGQTAPSPGITIRGAGLFILTHDVLVQHLRIRPGGAPEGPAFRNRDAITIGATSGQSTYNVVVDHVSCSWATDETISTWAEHDTGGVHDVTIQYCLVSEGLATSLNPGGPHSMGILVGRASQRVGVVRNVMAYCSFRNPLIRDDVTDVVVLNNLVHMPRQWTTDKISIGSRGNADWPLRVAIVGNAYNPVPNPHNANFISFSDNCASDTRVYLADNLAPNATDDPWDPAVVHAGRRGAAAFRADTPPIWHDGLRPIAARAVEEHLIASAGARPADRDPVDARIFRMIRERTVQPEVTDLSQVGGYPKLAKNRRPLELPAQPHGDDDADGYTNLEEWLHAHAAAVEGRAREP